ncbi:MAG: 3-oxoadipate enol-lactonase [Desulfobacteraceae bacterium]
MHVKLINGCHIHYRCKGVNGAPQVVFANSLGTDSRIWDGVLDRLGGGIESICYDKRGHGLSDAPPAPYTLDDHIGDLEGLLDQLEVEQAVICGISVGGMIALGLAARRPDMVRGLILCDTAHKIGSKALWNQRIDEIRRHGMEGIADAVLERWFSKSFRQALPEAVAGWRNMLIRTPVEGYIGTCAALRDADLTAAAKSLKRPVHCLCGSEDDATPPELVQSMGALIAGSRFELVDGAGHLPCIEAADPFAAAVRRFIEETNRDENNP